MTTENIATLEEIQEATINMQTINEEVKSTANTLVDQYGTTRKTMTGRETEFNTQIADHEAEFDAQLASQVDTFQNRFALSDTPIPWSAGLLIEDELQLYSTGTKGESGYSVWLPDPTQLPFTTGATFSEDEALNRWRVARTATVLESVALSLNTDRGNVTGSNAGTVLASYIHDDLQQKTYSVPADAIGKTIASVAGNVLNTTIGGPYNLLPVSGEIKVLTSSFGGDLEAAMIYARSQQVQDKYIWPLRVVIDEDITVANSIIWTHGNINISSDNKKVNFLNSDNLGKGFITVRPSSTYAVERVDITGVQFETTDTNVFDWLYFDKGPTGYFAVGLGLHLTTLNFRGNNGGWLAYTKNFYTQECVFEDVHCLETNGWILLRGDDALNDVVVNVATMKNCSRDLTTQYIFSEKYYCDFRGWSGLTIENTVIQGSGLFDTGSAVMAFGEGTNPDKTWGYSVDVKGLWIEMVTAVPESYIDLRGIGCSFNFSKGAIPEIRVYTDKSKVNIDRIETFDDDTNGVIDNSTNTLINYVDMLSKNESSIPFRSSLGNAVGIQSYGYGFLEGTKRDNSGVYSNDSVWYNLDFNDNLLAGIADTYNRFQFFALEWNTSKEIDPTTGFPCYKFVGGNASDIFVGDKIGKYHYNRNLTVAIHWKVDIGGSAVDFEPWILEKEFSSALPIVHHKLYHGGYLTVVSARGFTASADQFTTILYGAKSDTLDFTSAEARVYDLTVFEGNTCHAPMPALNKASMLGVPSVTVIDSVTQLPVNISVANGVIVVT